MALYYFDVDDNGQVFHDDHGTDCKDFAKVKKEAISALIDMIRESLPDGDHHQLSIKVRDDAGFEILEVALHFNVVTERRQPGPSSSRPGFVDGFRTINSSYVFFARQGPEGTNCSIVSDELKGSRVAYRCSSVDRLQQTPLVALCCRAAYFQIWNYFS
ncbi:DUF6894 family protein [Mesorhizobium loti]|uniref:DUF6894 family protein n=1 Tax=Rhizobium loti TaxID=381 RepID=UPI001267E7C8|nr:hypothetical protein [Mesorhizobium loti]